MLAGQTKKPASVPPAATPALPTSTARGTIRTATKCSPPAARPSRASSATATTTSDTSSKVASAAPRRWRPPSRPAREEVSSWLLGPCVHSARVSVCATPFSRRGQVLGEARDGGPEAALGGHLAGGGATVLRLQQERRGAGGLQYVRARGRALWNASQPRVTIVVLSHHVGLMPKLRRLVHVYSSMADVVAEVVSNNPKVAAPTFEHHEGAANITVLRSCDREEYHAQPLPRPARFARAIGAAPGRRRPALFHVCISLRRGGGALRCGGRPRVSTQTRALDATSRPYSAIG
ncbi:hypothetical protein M885DRAFT_221453 [Pelagophyceae sp. CCMP2097]|nr:hypothetical protein M885DRAFT_221453 [Pelagophyceae sp. CCMP2097]|mmetsp:Transcript_22757/g.79053  ORF Transcript_22757/g.79053 Transcript_22757/m.79053 type:complete len:292 (+) Transcript_22757:990-1865(+)